MAMIVAAGGFLPKLFNVIFIGMVAFKGVSVVFHADSPGSRVLGGGMAQ
jgi:hypothetical protein